MAYFSIIAPALATHALATSTISTTTLNPIEAIPDLSTPAPISIANPSNHQAPNVDLNHAIFLSLCCLLAVCFLLLVVAAARAALRIWKRLYVTRQLKKCKAFDKELEVYFEYSEWIHGDSVVKSADEGKGHWDWRVEEGELREEQE